MVLAIGSSLTQRRSVPSVPAGKTIIHSTNDASDINKEYRADHAVTGDAALVLDAVIAEVGRQKGAARGGNALAVLKEEVAAVKKAWLAEWAKHLDSDETPLNQYRVIRDLMRTVDRDNIIITHDSGSPREQLLPFFETTAAGSYMGWGKSTQLGYGLGIIMGAKLAAPKKLCVNVMGDAAIGMTGMDIETAARNRIAIFTIVFNNGVMGAERDVLKISDEKYGAMTVSGNYSKVAEGLNVASTRVEKPAHIVGGDQGGGRRDRNRRAVPARVRRQGRPGLLALQSRGIVGAHPAFAVGPIMPSPGEGVVTPSGFSARLRPRVHFTFFTTQSSITLAMSRLFFSIITMWPLPWMPLLCSGMYSVLTPA